MFRNKNSFNKRNVVFLQQRGTMETFLFAINAVLPLVILISIGYILKITKICNDEFFKQANSLVFKLFLPVNLFLNVYKVESFSNVNFKTPIFALCALAFIFFFGLGTCLLATKDNSKRGAIWQGVFRSNYAILGIPLAGLILGDTAISEAAVLSAFVVPAFNILAVIALSVFREDGKKPEIKKVLIGICKNPLIIGVVLGLIVLGIRALFVHLNWSFRISNVAFLNTSLEYISRVTTPLALIVLGGKFEFKSVVSDKKLIIIGTIVRLVVVPAIVLSVACGIFHFKGASVVALIIAFASPVAVSSAIMAQEMKADGELASSLVVSTTIGSVITLTIIIAIVKGLGLI